jgi:hypothetical protein
MQPLPSRRIVVDVSTLARWAGPPVGIVRVEHELTKRAQSCSDAAALGFWDTNTGQFRAPNPLWAPLILSWHGTIDPPINPPPDSAASVPCSRVGTIIMALERLRLTTGSTLIARPADRSQRAVLALCRPDFPLDDRRGRRLASVARGRI